MENNDRLIIELLKQGNEKAYKYLYDHHYVFLCKFAFEILKDPFWSETTVGDTIFHLWEIRETLEITVSLRAYLIRAVRNRCLNQLNLEHEKQEVSLSGLGTNEILVDSYFISDDYPLGILLERELEYEIDASVERLPADCKRVFKKSRFENKSYEDISQELGISINTVKYHIKNALSLLHRDLSKYLLLCCLLLLR